MKKRVIIIHGWGGQPENHFKLWLKTNLIGKGFEVLEPQMPHTDEPVFSEWLLALKTLVGTPDENTILVGHSLGCITCVKYLATLNEGEKLGGAVLIAGFYSDIGHGEIKDFYATTEEVEIAKKHANKFVSIGSDSDMSVPLLKVIELNDLLEGELIVENNKGHFCEEDGVTELPSALDAILRISGSLST